MDEDETTDMKGFPDWFVRAVAGTLIAGAVGWGAYTNSQIGQIKEVNASQTEIDKQTLFTLNRIDATLIRIEEQEQNRPAPVVRVVYRRPSKSTKKPITDTEWYEQP